MPVRRYVVTGRVQGVGYRFFAAREASRLGITGFVRNLGDLSVEVVARGPEAALGSLGAALAEGPPAARVSAVEEAELPTDEHWIKFYII